MRNEFEEGYCDLVYSIERRDMIQNCDTCGNHSISKHNLHLCKFKQCNMGNTVFYSQSIPKTATYHLDMKVCEWIPLAEQKETLEWTEGDDLIF